MDSEAAASTTTLPLPHSAPPPFSSSPEEAEPKEAAAASPASSSSELESRFLSGGGGDDDDDDDDEEPEFETASERPLPAEEAVPEGEVDSATEADGSLSGSTARDALPPDVLPMKRIGAPEARPSGDGNGVVSDADAQGSAPLPEVLGVEPPPPSPGLVDGGDRVLEENGHDDVEKEAVAVVEARSSSEDAAAGLGAESVDVEATPDGNTCLKVNGVDNGKIKDGAPGEKSGDGAAAAAGVEKNVQQDVGEGKSVDMGDGNGETQPVCEVGQKPGSYEESEMRKILGGASDGGKSSVAQAAGELKQSEFNIEESGGAQSGAGSGETLEMATSGVAFDNQGSPQPSETKEGIGYTEEEEDKALVSPEVKENVKDVEKEEIPKVGDLSLNPEEIECSVRKSDNLDATAVVDEIVTSGPADEGDGTEQVSAEPQMNSKDAGSVSDASEANVFPVGAAELQSLNTEDPENEQADSNKDVPVVSHVSDSGNATVVSVPDSDMKHTDDGSEAAAGEELMGLNVEADAEGEAASLIFDQPAKAATLESSETAKRIMEDLNEGSSGASSGLGGSHGHVDQIDGQIVSDSDEEVETDEEGEGKELLFDSAALTALLKAATGESTDRTINISAADGSRTFSIDRPAGLGSSASSLRPAPARTIRPSLFYPSDLAVAGEPEENIDEEGKKLREMVDNIRVKFLRLVHRLGHSPEDRVAAQVLYRLGLAEGIRHGRQVGRVFNLESAKKKALQLEEDGKEPLNFSCNILVLGKTGVGKSATINSIFGEEKVPTNAFEPTTPSVKEIIGTVDGIKIHVIDTPGLKPSVLDQTVNKRILASIKRYTKKCPPDIVLYVDRLDTQTWDFNDLPLLRSITSVLGSSIWFNAIVALTHAASAPPDGPSGSPLSYEVFVDQRSRIVQHAIRQAAGDMRLMNPVALVENHPSCRKNREGQRVLPNGLNWRTQLLLLCYSSKILSEANSLLKLQDPSHGKLFGFRVRSPPLPFLLSSLLQSRAHPKLATDQGGDNYDSDIDLGDLSESDQEEEEGEYDQLPPFKPLRKAQIAKLTKEQRKAYFDEYDYRVKLLQKKQWKEEIRRLKQMKKTGRSGQDESGYGDMADDYDQDSAPAAVPVPLPDMVLPPSFDCENPAYRYRFLEPTSQLLARPVLDTHGWDHDCGYDGVSLEENLSIAGRYPGAFTVQITKDKKEFSIHLDSSISAKHGGTRSTLAGFDIQTVGKQLAYILRCESKFKNLKKNTTAAGMSVTFLGENIATGLKVEDQLLIGKRLGFVASAGAIRAQGDVAYGANLEVRLRDKDFPIGQDASTLGLSLMRWRSDLALGANLQSQFSVGRSSKMAVRVGLNNKLSGQITVRTSTSEQLHIAFLGIVPLAISIYRSIWSGETY